MMAGHDLVREVGVRAGIVPIYAINESYPYLKLKGTSGTARAYVAATVVLYGKNGLVRDTVTAAQVVDL